MIDGRTVMEVFPESKSAEEIADLWDYINDRLEKNFRRTVFQSSGSTPLRRQHVQQNGFGRKQVGA